VKRSFSIPPAAIVVFAILARQKSGHWQKRSENNTDIVFQSMAKLDKLARPMMG
jgi:hypothetical protein